MVSKMINEFMQEITKLREEGVDESHIKSLYEEMVGKVERELQNDGIYIETAHPNECDQAEIDVEIVDMLTSKLDDFSSIESHRKLNVSEELTKAQILSFIDEIKNESKDGSGWEGGQKGGG